MAEWYLPDVLINPLGTLWDTANAFPLGILSMTGVAPSGSKEQQVKVFSAFVPAKVGKQTFKQYTSEWVEQSKKTTPDAKQFWSEDTIPEPVPGFDILTQTDWGKYIPWIIGGVLAIWLLPKIFGGKK